MEELLRSVALGVELGVEAVAVLMIVLGSLEAVFGVAGGLFEG